ncbi:MAG: PilN domain-containing protein [Elusimicrobia bacterium]|nr:PilN domain-containing protein [Elusimicrobiota bacterium]
MIKINLVPQEILARAQQKQRAVQFGVAGAAVALIIVLVSLGFVARLHRLEKKLAADKAELKRLEAIVAKVKEMETMAAQLRARLQVIDDLDRGRRAYPYMMNDFVRSVPAGVRVKTLVTNGGGGSPFKLNMSAEARSNEDIRSWMRKMDESGRFSGVELGTVNAQESALEVLRSFSLTATHTPQL